MHRHIYASLTTLALTLIVGCAEEPLDDLLLFEDQDGVLAEEDTGDSEPEWVAEAKAESPCPAGTTASSWTSGTRVSSGNTYTITATSPPTRTGTNYWQYINDSSVSSVGSVSFYVCSGNTYSSRTCSSSSPSDTITWNYKQHTFTTTSSRPYPVGRLTATRSGTIYMRGCYAN